MDRWFYSPKIFDHLWGCKTKAVGTVMSNRKEMHKQAFSGKLKKGEKICQRDPSWPSSGRTSMMSFFLTNAHDYVLVEALSSRVAHHKIKPAAVLN
jgi:hypothetical protein